MLRPYCADRDYREEWNETLINAGFFLIDWSGGVLGPGFLEEMRGGRFFLNFAYWE